MNYFGILFDMATIRKTTVSLVLAAILLASVAVLPGSISVANAQIGSFVGQDITIRTSADDHGAKFFGEGVLQVVIKDDTRDDDEDDTIQVRIDADSRNADVSRTFEVPNTNAGSQRFEFFLVHAQSQYADGMANDGTPLDPISREGFDDPADGFDGIGAPIIRFGTDAGSGVELQTGSGLYEEVTFDIRYADERITIRYDDTISQLLLDREAYGTDSIVYIRIDDQDANLNPTRMDSFTVTDADLNELFELSGLSFEDDVMFRETGDNTAVFEGKLQLVRADTASDDPAELAFSSESASITLNDKVNYANVSGPENDSNNTSSVNIVIEDEDGRLDDVTELTFGRELKLTLRDNDQNKDSDKDETITGRVKVRVGTGDANGNGQLDAGEGDEEFIRMEETDDNSGVFVIDLANNELKITFLAEGEVPRPQNGILELRKADIDKDITILYEDPLDSDSMTSITSRFIKKMLLTTGVVSLPDSAGINDDFVLTITDPDLNDNPRTRDSYSFTLSGNSGTFPLTKGGKSIGEMATIEMEIAGRIPAFGTPITYTLTETEVNSGVFSVNLKMAKILESANINVDDGDRIRITYNDLMGSTSRESSDTLVIARSSLAVDFSRELLPIPPVDNPADPAPESSVGGFVGTRSVTTLIVTDVRANLRSNSEDSIDFRFRNDPGVQGSSFTIRVEGNGIRETIDTTAKYDGTDPVGVIGNTGVVLKDILPELPTLKETGRSTGVFSEDLEFVNDGSLRIGDWHNLRVIVTYFNSAGDSESTGITFRGSEGFVSVDKLSVRTGDILTITVQDPDLNLDDSVVEQFRTSLDTNGFFILAIEPEDDRLKSRSVNAEIFRETGEDTGIFTATFVIGRDIPVTEDENGKEVNQARNILITYNDEIDSTGGSGDEIEINIPVTSSSGSIQVNSDEAGPGSKVQVLIIDSDLDINPLRTDKFEGDNSGNGFVVFRTDRREAGRASPDLEETGPNTGVFRFDIQLTPIEGGDDGRPIDVRGGSDPRIGVLPGDLLAIRYEDEHDANGQKATISKVIRITSWDPEFQADKDSYDENDRVNIIIVDPDANQNPDIADSLTGIRVYSDSDRVGQTFSALETDKNSGQFKLSFMLTTGVRGGAVTADLGDEVTVVYEDDFPADYAERVKDVSNPDKRFFYTFIVGADKAGINATTPSPPMLKNLAGEEITQVEAGQLVVLTTEIKNNNPRVQPFTALVEVRDPQDVTMYLQWQIGILNPSGTTEIGLSWTPEEAGDYRIRTFVISDFENPAVLSTIVTSEVSVQ
jgi:hypothetical protein